MPRESLTIPTHRGHDLAAKLELPAGTPRAMALFAHCFTCSKDLKAVVRIAEHLVKRGFAVLRFDFTGLGQSGGEFSNTTFATNLEDLTTVANYLAEHHRPVDLLIGHSLGGAAVIAAARDLSSVKAVATIGAPSSTAHLRDSLAAQAPEIEAAGCAEVELAGRPFFVRKAFLDDLAEDRVERATAALDRALLIMHSPVDATVGIEHAAKLFGVARHPKSFIALDGADHLLMDRPADAAFVADILSAWAARYVESAPA